MDIFLLDKIITPRPRIKIHHRLLFFRTYHKLIPDVQQTVKAKMRRNRKKKLSSF